MSLYSASKSTKAILLSHHNTTVLQFVEEQKSSKPLILGL